MIVQKLISVTYISYVSFRFMYLSVFICIYLPIYLYMYLSVSVWLPILTSAGPVWLPILAFSFSFFYILNSLSIYLHPSIRLSTSPLQSNFSPLFPLPSSLSSHPTTFPPLLPPFSFFPPYTCHTPIPPSTHMSHAHSGHKTMATGVHSLQNDRDSCWSVVTMEEEGREDKKREERTGGEKNGGARCSGHSPF